MLRCAFKHTQEAYWLRVVACATQMTYPAFPFCSQHLLQPRSHLTTGMAVLVSVFPQMKKCLHYTAFLISRVTEKGPTRDSLGITVIWQVL